MTIAVYYWDNWCRHEYLNFSKQGALTIIFVVEKSQKFGSKLTKNPQLMWTPIIFLYFANNAFNNTFHNTKETASWNFQRTQRNGVITLFEGGAGGGVGSEESFLLFPTTDQPLTDLKKGGE